MTDEARDLKADLAAAWDQQDNHEEVDEPTPTSVDMPEAEPANDGEEGVPHETDDERPPAAEKEGEAGEKPEKPARSKKPDDEPKADAEGHSLDTPPRGLTATQREAWKDTPKEIREAMHKRSEDYSEGIKKYAQKARNADIMEQVLTPHRQLFATNNATPPQLVGQLLQTASVLQMGTPHQKAGLVANMVKQFGIDINTLDSALVGENSAPAQESSELDRRLQERLRPLEEQLSQYRQRDMSLEQQRQAEINDEIQRFAQDPQNEFYRDVRGEMADWLDMASKNGREMSLKEAYDRACQNNPEIAKVLQSRKATEAVRRKRPAASSVHGTRGGSGSSGGEPKSVRDALINAMEGEDRI